MNRLPHHQGIDKFFAMLGLALYFSKPVMKHLVHIIDALTTKEFVGNLTDLHHESFHPNHRTTLSHFSRKALGMKKSCFANSSSGCFVMWNERPSERITPFLFRSMIRSAEKRSLRHRRNTLLKGVIGIILTRTKSRFGDTLSSGSWFIR